MSTTILILKRNSGNMTRNAQEARLDDFEGFVSALTDNESYGGHDCTPHDNKTVPYAHTWESCEGAD